MAHHLFQIVVSALMAHTRLRLDHHFVPFVHLENFLNRVSVMACATPPSRVDLAQQVFCALSVAPKADWGGL
jgi:hypothetical protein